MVTKQTLRRVTFSAGLTTWIAVACAIAVHSAHSQQPTDQTAERKILLTAIDREQRPVLSLQGADLRVTEQGVAQPIVALSFLKDRPLSVLILIDVSLSQERSLPSQKSAATAFVNSAIKDGRDQIGVVTFTGTARLEQSLTNDLPLLSAAVKRAEVVFPAGYTGGGVVVGPPSPASKAAAVGSTAIWDAVIAAADYLGGRANSGTRRAVILLTDGLDTTSKSSSLQAIDRANREDVAVYSIGVGEDKSFGLDKDPLKKLSERTGARAFFPKAPTELPQIFDRIQYELRNQYELRYRAAATRSKKVKIDVVNPALKDIKLSYQQSAPVDGQP